MADFRRFAKPSSEWTDTDLEAYHITISSQTRRKFFGVPHLPLPTHPTLVDFMNNEGSQNVSGHAKKLLYYLNIAVYYPFLGNELAVANFMAKLLETLGYDDHRRIIFICHPLPLTICGELLPAEMDISVIGDNEVLMLVRVNKESGDVAEPEVIAGAIAAYAANNKFRVASQDINLPPLDAMTIPAIAMNAATNPVFYKIPVTAELSEAVARGTYPTTKTRVLRYTPQLPVPPMYGVRVHENIPELLACLEAFKQFVRN